MWNSLLSFAPAVFIMGVCVTKALDHYNPNAWRYLLVFAAAFAFANALMSYRQLRRSRARCREHLAELEAINPEMATKMKEFFPDAL
jgi:hypothetical protein